MSFAMLSSLSVGLGLAGLAGLLFALQRLRVQSNELVVATTMFWRAAVREAPVRVFMRRFRHVLAYLLTLLIAGLLWLAFAGPQSDKQAGEDYYILFLDGSAETGSSVDFDRAVSALRRDLSQLRRDTREVIWGGGHAFKILDAGEDSLLFDRRLGALEPEAAVSSLDETLRLIALNQSLPENINFIVYGRSSVSKSVLDALPDGVRVRAGLSYSNAAGNRAITALGMAESSSGRWDGVDVLVRVSSDDPSEKVSLDAVTFILDGEIIPPERIEAAGVGAFVARDIDTTGGVFEVSLSNDDAIAFDNVARLVLPKRAVIAVRASSSVPPRILDVIEADRGLRLVTDEEIGDIAVRLKGEDFAPGLPALQLGARDSQESAFEVGYVSDLDPQTVLERSLASLGLDQIDATVLASAIDEPIGASVYPSEQRSVNVWLELMEPQYNFAQSRAFPLFVSKSLRWLGQDQPAYAYLAAGRALEDRSAVSSLAPANEEAFNVLGAEFTPVRAGQVSSDDGERVYEVSLLGIDAVSSGNNSGRVELEQSGSLLLSGVSGTQNLFVWLVFVVLFLLGAEWVLYQRGRMP